MNVTEIILAVSTDNELVKEVISAPVDDYILWDSSVGYFNNFPEMSYGELHYVSVTNLFDSIQQPLQEVLPLGVSLLRACSGQCEQ